MKIARALELAARGLWRGGGLPIVVLIMLAAAIGAATVIFSVT